MVTQQCLRADGSKFGLRCVERVVVGNEHGDAMRALDCRTASLLLHQLELRGVDQPHRKGICTRDTDDGVENMNRDMLERGCADDRCRRQLVIDLKTRYAGATSNNLRLVALEECDIVSLQAGHDYGMVRARSEVPLVPCSLNEMVQKQCS